MLAPTVMSISTIPYPLTPTNRSAIYTYTNLHVNANGGITLMQRRYVRILILLFVY
jgi:hypothetical protein